MVYLGIHAGHNASACLMVNGNIVLAIQEERFSKMKNHGGYPKEAIEYCKHYMEMNNLKLDRLAFSTTNLSAFWAAYPVHHYYNMKDYHYHYGEGFYGPKLKGIDVSDYYDFIIKNKDRNKVNLNLNFDCFNTTDQLLNDTNKFRELLKDTVAKQCSISNEQIDFLDHHTCHAYYAYFGCEKKNVDCNIITMDSFGDGLNLTVWKSDNGNLEKIGETNQCDIGRIYKITTLLLGMKPDEHEFKVMGMDPYAKPEYVDIVYNDVYANLLKVENGLVVHDQRPNDMYEYLSEKLKPYRFDNIAGAVQKFVEVLAKELFRQVSELTGLKSFCVSGGVSMNIKMNMVLSEMDFVNELYVPASGGDESLSIGACYYLNGKESAPLKNTYLGYQVNNVDVEKVFTSDVCIIESNVKCQKVAELLAAGEIVASVRGREEFGARALGNRSILASPNNPEVIKVINEMIKNRDFWMPFALSILEEYNQEYFYNDKNIISSFMTIGFKTKNDNYNKIKAGTHPYDRTCRPQFVSEKWNSGYYELIKAYYNITGTPALLNTSLNLHGNPICSNLTDVKYTFLNSSLKYIYINDFYLIKKK